MTILQIVNCLERESNPNQSVSLCHELRLRLEVVMWLESLGKNPRSIKSDPYISLQKMLQMGKKKDKYDFQ